MSKHVASTTERKRATPVAAPESPYGSLLEVNWQTFERTLRGMMEVSQEVAEFAHSRLQEDAAAWMRLVSCRNPNEAFECQRHFAERTAQEYLMESKKLSQMISGVAAGGSPRAGHGVLAS